MGEAVGRFSRAARRALQLGGLHGHDGNCHRHRGGLLGWMRFLCRHMPEGLLHRKRCAVPIPWVYFTPLTAVSLVSPVYRSCSLWCKVVVERLHKDGRGGLLGKLNAAELQLELLMPVAARLARLAELARRAESCFLHPVCIP